MPRIIRWHYFVPMIFEGPGANGLTTYYIYIYLRLSCYNIITTDDGVAFSSASFNLLRLLPPSTALSAL